MIFSVKIRNLLTNLLVGKVDKLARFRCFCCSNKWKWVTRRPAHIRPITIKVPMQEWVNLRA